MMPASRQLHMAIASILLALVQFFFAPLFFCQFHAAFEVAEVDRRNVPY